MKQLIAEQVQFILLMTMSGMALMLGYDGLRVIRWLFPHGKISIAVEDLLYWIIVSVPVFYLFLVFHDGIIRWYGLVSVFGGIVLYEYGLSRPIRSRIAAFFNRIRRKWKRKWEQIWEKRKQVRQKKQEIKNKQRIEQERIKSEKQEKKKQERIERKNRGRSRRGIDRTEEEDKK